ncbi:hypothetical protein M9H77_07474 [Catharanthus roseus]|uniref:Uncharacterized protein n=1 Tax=Catharanthus roseus TaxID=4058 RepID=A0ACC0BV92_CATRO|nr:hypothetical protein M9H77_07474 [Catharanthus roseus]
MKLSCCDISSSLNSLSSKEGNLFTNSNNHFLAFFSQSVQKFEAQKKENEGILGYKLYKTISFLPSTSFLIQTQFLNLLTTTYRTNSNRGMKAKEEGMGKELSISFEDTSLRVKLFLELYASYVTLMGNVMEFKWLQFCGKKMNGSFKVFKVHPCDLVKTTFENSVSELALKDLDEKLVYPISFIDYLLKRDIVKDFLVQNTTSCVKLLNKFIDDILLYSLTSKDFKILNSSSSRGGDLGKDLDPIQQSQEDA